MAGKKSEEQKQLKKEEKEKRPKTSKSQKTEKSLKSEKTPEKPSKNKSKVKKEKSRKVLTAEEKIEKEFLKLQRRGHKPYWFDRHHVTFSKSNPLLSSFCREYFDVPKDPPDFFSDYVMALRKGGGREEREGKERRGRRREEKEGERRSQSLYSRFREDPQGFSKFSPLSQRSRELRPLSPSPSSPWLESFACIKSKDNHLCCPGQRMYF